jgi:hypothetical protein
MALAREEKDMEYKLKENVKVDSLTFRKKVLEETIDLMGVIKNYTATDLEFNLMLGFLDNMIEGDTLLESLAQSTRLVNEIEDKIEPLYQDIIVNNELNLQAYNSLLEELKDYCDREVESNRRITGLLYTILEEVGDLNQEQLMDIINQVVDLASNGFMQKMKYNIKEEKPVIAPKKTPEEIKIENEKILELVNKFANHKDIAE